MAKENKIINIIKSRIQMAQNGTLFFNNSFPEFDDEYVGQILSDLAKDGIIHHLSRGVYFKTEETRFGIVYPPIEDIAKAIARRDNAQVIPTGATAQNILGLSTQVPMNAVFLTSGSARMIKLGSRTITFRRAVPKNFAVQGRYTSLIVQTLKSIGEENFSEDDFIHIQDIILRHPEPDTIEQDITVMPSWIRKIFVRTLKTIKKWLFGKKLDISERIAAVQTTAASKNIEDRAVEKDWWVTAVLKALFTTSCSDYLLFKGGTSISKGWPIIERFSEHIDLSLGRQFFLEVRNLSCAAVENNTQLKNLRKASRKYIHGTLSKELDERLSEMGIVGFAVENQTTQPAAEGPKPIDADSDPTVILVNYDSIFPAYDGDILPRVKIVISCLSMSEPFEAKPITTLIHNQFPELDEALSVDIRTVTPSRTFLEKAFLLNEEFQKEKPRSRRMSRHLYDL